jgi:hypothetical protein
MVQREFLFDHLTRGVAPGYKYATPDGVVHYNEFTRRRASMKYEVQANSGVSKTPSHMQYFAE